MINLSHVTLNGISSYLPNSDIIVKETSERSEFNHLRLIDDMKTLLFFLFAISILNRIDGIMVSVLASSVVDRSFDPRSGQTKNYKRVICSFSSQHVVLRRESKDG